MHCSVVLLLPYKLQESINSEIGSIMKEEAMTLVREFITHFQLPFA